MAIEGYLSDGHCGIYGGFFRKVESFVEFAIPKMYNGWSGRKAPQNAPINIIFG